MPYSKMMGSEIFIKAINTFGVTSNALDAGYILPNGLMLDFHRSIFTHNKTNNIENICEDFLKFGAIRINIGHVLNDHSYLTFELTPTEDQLYTLKHIFKNYHMEHLTIERNTQHLELTGKQVTYTSFTTFLKNSTPQQVHNQTNLIEITKAEHSLTTFLDQHSLKFKPYDGQVVGSTSNYFYKFYVKKSSVDMFSSVIRAILATIYREEYGLHWVLNQQTKENICIDIEEREKVKVCDDTTPIEDLQKALGGLIAKITERLDNFSFIKQEITKHIPYFFDVYDLQLIRDCILKPEDYGITNNGNIILLDDTDWKFVFCKKSENYDLSYVTLPPLVVLYNNDYYYFSKLESIEDVKEIINNDQRPAYQFWLIEADFDKIESATPRVLDSRFNYLNHLTKTIISSNQQITNQQATKIEGKHND